MLYVPRQASAGSTPTLSSSHVPQKVVGSGYSQATVHGEVAEAAALGAGILKMRVYSVTKE
ncbi:hypothetical protein CN238_04770 [Sinorhizobium meliloti]|nr:hypothetical protein CN238_04770 [Sinorhizobium meliloti]